MVKNAWGREVPPPKPTDLLFVPEDERVDDDSIDPDNNSNALDDKTGDDVGDLTPYDLLKQEGAL